MFSEQLKKILNLVKKTGDRVVIYDASAPDDSYIVMTLDNYISDYSVKPGLAANVSPIAEVSSVLEDASVSQIKTDLEPNSEKIVNLTEEDLTDKINREISMWKNRDNSVYLGEENKPKKAWNIPSQVKDKAQEVE